MATVREAVEEKRKKNKNNEEEKKTSLSVREAVEQKRNSSLSTNNTNKKPTFDYETGKKGWQKYLEDQSSAEQKKAKEKEDEKWWETLGRWLGDTGPADTTLPLGNTSQIINDVREDDRYTKPSDDWSEDQQYEFGALYLESPSKAFEFAERINNENNKAKEAAEIEKIQRSATASDWGKIGHTAGAIASAGLGLADYLNMLVMANAGRDPSASDGIVSPFEYSTAVTEGVASDLNNAYGTLDDNIPIFGGKGWGDVYGLGVSIAQSAISGYTLGPGGTLVSYFGQGAASGMKDALERGASEGQAAIYGAALGAFEGIAEQIGIDNLFKLGSASTIKGLLKNILKQAGAEGMEEGLTSILSNIADNVIMQDKSNFYAMVSQYMALGMSEEEAKKKAWMDSVEGIAFDTIAGAVSGGVHGGLQTGIQTGKYSSYVKNAFGNQAQDIVNDALNSPHSSVQEIGQKYQEKLDSGKSLSGWNLYELLETTDSNKIKDATLKRLGELGETSDVTAVAEVLVKQAMGQELSSKDQNILNNSKYGNLVSTELMHENILSDGLFDKWSENIGTRMVSPEVYNKGKNVIAEDFPNKIVTKGVPEEGIATEAELEASEEGDATLDDTISIMNNMVEKMELSDDVAGQMLEHFKPSDVQQAKLYQHAVPLAYNYGKIGYSAGLRYITSLSEQDKNYAYRRGAIDALIEADSKQSQIESSKTGSAQGTTKKKGIIYEGSYEYKEKTATPLQKSSMKVIEVINAISNLEIHVFESVEENGRRVYNLNGEKVNAPNGYFKDGNKIYIDINAGQHGEGLMLDTLGHEVTHYIRENDAKGFKAIADFLIEQYGKKGVNVEALLEGQRKKIRKRYAREGAALPSDAKLNDMAYEELVADAMSEMLSDPKAYDKLAKLKQQNRSAWETLRDAIKNILDKIKSILDQYKSEKRKVAKDAATPEANAVRDFSADAYEKLQDLYIKAFVEADANYEASKDSTKTASEDAKHSERDDDIATKINQSMTMAEAKRMVESAYKVNNIAEYYEDEYKDAEDWLRKAGPDEVEMYIENDYDLQAKYVNSNEDILNEEYRISDVLNAYLAGTLVGKAKPKAKRLDVSKSTKLKDSRFYSPQKIEDAKATFELAKQKAVGKDAAAINRARAEILLFAHNKGAAELLGVTQAELNKRLRSWSNYSATAKSISERINAGVAEENRWTGIENSSYINKARVTNEDIERLVASVEGDSRGYERKYIARVMLAADTHIDYSGLKFKFATSQQVNQDNNSGGRVLGFYNDTNRLIEVTHDKPHTVAHEMGHYIDAQWGRDLLGSTTSSHFLTRGINENMVRDRYGEQGVQFLNNFKIFINSLTDVNSNNSSYTNDRAEVFARFFARFVEWTDNIATGNRYYSYETSMYNDKFTQAQYIEFARLLQEKALLDGSLTSFEEPKFSDIDILYSDRNPREVTESDVRYILDNIESYDKDSYFPVRVNTPHALIDAAKKRGDIIENLPVVMQVKKAQQAMSDEAPRSSIERSHGLSSDDMIAILRAMDNPAYIVYQENGRYAEIVRFETEAKKRAIAILEIGENKNAIHMNGYEGGIYQVLVTAFVPDSYQYIKGILDNKKNTILPIEKKKGSSQRSSGSQVPSLLNESPFFEDSIPQNTDSVNREFENSDEKYSERDPNATSNRTLLANALDSVAKNDIEKNKLKQYKTKIALIESEQARLTKIRAEIKKLSFAKGPRDSARIASLQETATQIENRINTYDRQLLKLESTEALKGVLDREKKMAYKRAEQKGKEALKRQKEKDAETVRTLLAHHRESRMKSIEGRNKTAMRAKIKKVVSELNQLLLHGSKERNVKLGLQEAVAAALDAINMDTVGADERIAKYNALIAKATDEDVIASLVETRDRIKAQGDSLGDKLKALKEAYYAIQHSEESKNYPAHFKDEAALIEQRIQNVIDKVGNASLRNMSLAQLDLVYDMYKMVLTTIQNVNKVWREGKALDLQENASAVMTELEAIKELGEEGTKIGEHIRSYSWNEMTPYYAFDRIGSKTFKSFFMETIRGQNVYAKDVAEAKEFADKTRKKYGYTKWDLDKVYEFKLKDGRTFQVTLKHMLSIYAYSKRDQALPHMSTGGFFFNDKSTFRKKGGIIELIRRTDSGYKIDAEILAEINEALGDKVNYVDEMQDYLTKMGEKGNEVTRTLWGIDLFKEKVYFPLKSMSDFIKKSTETAQSVSLKNDGMTKETVPGANNPIVLEAFDDVWASHIDRMSQYHAFVIPIDNLNKLHQYGTWAETESMAVSTMLTGRFGSAVNEYITQFIKDLNGNVVNPGAKNPLMGFLSKFKKTAVGASLSTVVQQPTAVLRAMADINAKYFIGKPNTKKLSNQWEELKQYAPIAIIKDIGGFDAGSGVQVSNWLNNDTLRGVDKVMNTIDDISMKGAEVFDQLGWTSIWEAVKREIGDTTNLKVGSDEFLKKAGERFTEVIVRTQVYDSTLSRSGFMRSKSDTMKMLTAFMGEPTLSMNMMFNAIINAKRGGSKKQAVRTIGFTYASIIAASALSSLIYALRDDDDDESYLEKYMQSLGGEFISDVVLAPVTSLPAVKDIVSIFQGWDVERTDVAIFKDIKDAFDGLSSETKSPYRKVEDFAGAIASAFGLPLKNVLRTGREIYNAFSAITDDISGGDVGGAFVEGITGKGQSKPSQLYNAIINGDDARLERIKSSYKDESSYLNAVKTALRENDSRIKEAAQARLDGNISEYTRIAREIIAEGHFSQDTVVAAINSEMSAIKKGESTQTESTDSKDEVTSIYRADDINVAFDNGDTSLALSIIDELVEMKMANGMDEKKAKSSLRSSMTSYWKPLYKQAYASGNTAEMQRIKQILYKSVLYGSATEVIKDVNSWLKN